MPMSPHRPTLAGILLAVVAVLTSLPILTAAAVEPEAPRYDKIALTALAYEGTFQGQCWPFVQQVVLEATGKRIGFDYRDGFFEAGAVEVTVDDARSGDIIQVVDDGKTTANADYPGLHTAIVLDNLGGGVFNVIDSNSQWDGMVRRRLDYSPAEAAARYGINFHVYRIGGDASPRGSVPARTAQPPAGDSYQAGDLATVDAQGDCLNLRAAPGVDNKVIACIPDGTTLKVLDVPLTVGGRAWVKISVLGTGGWVAGEFLTKVTPTAPASGASKTSPVLPYRTFSAMITLN